MHEYWLVSIIKSTIKKDKAKYSKTLGMMIEKLLGHMADIDKEADGRNNITQCMLALNLFCIANPEILTSQFSSLLTYIDDSYLKRDPPKSTMIFYATSIVDMVCLIIIPLILSRFCRY
jgi:hypothetical protein